MDVGMMMVFASYGWENCPDHQVWEEEIRLARLAADSGFDCVWSAEHHFADYSFVPDNLQLMTYLAGLCPNVDFGTAAVILPWHDPLRVVFWIFLFAGLSALPFGFTGLMRVAETGISATGAGSVAFVVVGATAVPYLLNSWALARVASSVVAVYILVQPVVAGTMGRIFLGEHFGPNTAVAAALIVAGVAMAVVRPKAVTA